MLPHASIPRRFLDSRRQSRSRVFSRNGKLLRVVRRRAAVRKLFSRGCQTRARKRRSWRLNFPPRALPPGCGRKHQRAKSAGAFPSRSQRTTSRRGHGLAAQMHSRSARGERHIEPVVYKNARRRRRSMRLGLSHRSRARFFSCDSNRTRASIREVRARINPSRESAPSQRRQRWPREFSQVNQATVPEESSDFRSVT